MWLRIFFLIGFLVCSTTPSPVRAQQDLDLLEMRGNQYIKRGSLFRWRLHPYSGEVFWYNEDRSRLRVTGRLADGYWVCWDFIDLPATIPMFDLVGRLRSARALGLLDEVPWLAKLRMKNGEIPPHCPDP